MDSNHNPQREIDDQALCQIEALCVAAHERVAEIQAIADRKKADAARQFTDDSEESR